MQYIRIFFLTGIIAATGCQLEMPEGQFECTSNDECPGQWFCDTDNLCYKSDADDSETDSFDTDM